MLSVKVQLEAFGWWRSGRVLEDGTGIKLDEGEIVPASKVFAIRHYPRGEPVDAPSGVVVQAHEGCSVPPEAINWLVLLGTILFEGKRDEFERDAGGADWRTSRNGKPHTVATLSAVRTAVTTTGGVLEVAAAGE